MKRTLISITVFLILISFSCRSKDVSKSLPWRERFGIKPNTGVFAGKIKLTDFLEGKTVVVFLTKQYNGELVAYDTISENGIILIKNLSPGRYFVDAYPDSLYFIRKNVPLGLLGYHTFRGNCRSFYIEIDSNIIRFINSEIPGGFIDEMPPVHPEGSFEIRNKMADSCELSASRKELNEENYSNIYSLKMAE